MKTTVKEYQAKARLRANLNCSAENVRFTDVDLYHGLKHEADKIDEEYFDKIPTVSVSFYIGYRKYYQDVVKIGKTYFDRSVKMTKSRGYRSIQEIPEITERMTRDMIDDMHYY